MLSRLQEPFSVCSPPCRKSGTRPQSSLFRRAATASEAERAAPEGAFKASRGTKLRGRLTGKLFLKMEDTLTHNTKSPSQHQMIRRWRLQPVFSWPGESDAARRHGCTLRPPHFSLSSHARGECRRGRSGGDLAAWDKTLGNGRHKDTLCLARCILFPS